MPSSGLGNPASGSSNVTVELGPTAFAPVRGVPPPVAAHVTSTFDASPTFSLEGGPGEYVPESSPITTELAAGPQAPVTQGEEAARANAPVSSGTGTPSPVVAELPTATRHGTIASLGFADGFSGWTIREWGGSEGAHGTALPGSAVLNEGNSFLVRLERSFALPENATSLIFTYQASFDNLSAGTIKDAFEVALVDQDGQPLVQAIGPGKVAFFNDSEDLGGVSGGNTSFVQQSGSTTVTVDLSSVLSGELATVVFRLINNDEDQQSSIHIESAELLGDTNFCTWQNPANRLNTNADGLISPIDALLTVNKLNRDGAGDVPELISDATPPPYFDVNCDALISPIDVLLIINHLNSFGAGDAYWTIDGKTHQVTMYLANGQLVGAWQALGLTHPEGLANHGQDLWVVEAGRVARYQNAAVRTRGEQSTSHAFELVEDNVDPTGPATDGTTLWVTDAAADTVFVYNTVGDLLGRWQLDPANSDPSGITNEPGGGSDLWVVDRADSAVYRYGDAVTRLSLFASATAQFSLAPTNGSPEGIADPPVVTIITPDEAGRFRDGETILVTGNVVSSDPIAEITTVTVNDRPVQVIDSAGKFFEQVTIAPGRNRFDVSATDSAGDSSTSSVTIAGVQPAPDTIDFSRFSDVSGSFTGQYGHTSFKAHTNILFADLAIRNTGTYLADTPLLAGVTNLSDPSVRVRGFDGTTPDGMRYFDFAQFVDDRTLDPGE